jgi:hypothetical protein
MRMRALVVSLALLASGLVLPAMAATVTCPEVAPPQLGFGPVNYIDRARAGGEPVSVIAQDGAIVVSSHGGTTHLYKNPDAAAGAGDFAVGYTNQTLNWRSTDGGATWSFIGFAGAGAGPHSATSTGYSDPDLAMDAGGRIYNTEIDLANIAVYSSPDDGQSFPTGNPLVASGDRPWLTGGKAEEVWMTENATLRQLVFHSVDAGITWSLINSSAPVSGKMLLDPTDTARRTLVAPYNGNVSISRDSGVNWHVVGGPALGPRTEFFSTIALDSAGWVYEAAAGGYRSTNDVRADGAVTFSYLDRATEEWGGTVTIPTPRGDALWAWLIAGDDGRAAVVWLQNLAGIPREFYIYAAYTTNAHGTTVVCSDGSKRFAPPRFSVVNASRDPVHIGAVCLDGTACNASTGDRGDRRLGDFLTINFDMSGRLFIVSGDTRLPNPVGGPKPVSNPIFIGQTAGARMLAEPGRARATRCLFPLPSC